MFGAMGHLPPAGQEKMVGEVWRVLSPGGIAIFTNGNLWSPFALPTTLAGGRVRIEGVRVRVHSTTPRKFRELLGRFEVCVLESYDYSYVPMLPLKFTASLLGRGLPPHLRPLDGHLRPLPLHSHHALVRQTVAGGVPQVSDARLRVRRSGSPCRFLLPPRWDSFELTGCIDDCGSALLGKDLAVVRDWFA